MELGDRVQRTATLRSEGLSSRDVARLTRGGDLFRIRRGAYAGNQPEEVEARHRQLLEASLPLLTDGAVVSHGSAALLHGLPTPNAALAKLHVIRNRDYGGRRGSLVHVHPAPLPPGDAVMLDDIAVTNRARTVVDCARTWSFEWGVAVGDAALGAGLQRPELFAVLSRPRRFVGNARARSVVEFLDPRAESAGESLSRVQIYRAGLPVPTPQYEVVDPRTGELVARCDFGWPELRTVGEFDGQVKYGRLLKPGQTAGDVIYQEKVREDRLRDLGWEVVRWVWDDLYAFTVVVARIHRAFVRGSHRL